MSPLAKGLVGLGILLVVLGLIVAFLPKIPFLGRLPGDLVVRRENFTFYFPLTTSLLLSAILTLLFSFFGKK
jgi:hypothetical protein